MSTTPLVSVVVPVHNSATTLARTLQSIVDQTFRDFEIIVADDGSTDETRTLAESFAPHVSLKYVYQSGGGAGMARVKGIRAARGEFLAFCDSDDVWSFDKLEKQMALFAPDTALVYSDALVCGEMFLQSKTAFRSYDIIRPYRGKVYENLIRKNFIVASSVVVRKSFLEDFTSLPMSNCHDWPMWLLVARKGGLFDYVAQPLVWYYEHPGGTSRGKQGKIGVAESRIKVRQHELAVIKSDIKVGARLISDIKSLMFKDMFLVRVLKATPSVILDRLGLIYYTWPKMRRAILKTGICD